MDRDAGVLLGADGDQQLALIDARLAVMDVERMGYSATLASASIAVQDLVAEAGEVMPGMRRGAEAGAAEAGDERKVPATGAEEGGLGGSSQN